VDCAVGRHDTVLYPDNDEYAGELGHSDADEEDE
jgi:hypothetical protein